MTEVRYYGAGFPYRQLSELPGKLIVLEGTDAVGRSTQTQLLRHWLESEGHAVSDTGLRRSALTAPGLDAAKLGNTLGPRALSLFYATDFADRLESQIIPALKAGFIVLSDRYFRMIVRYVQSHMYKTFLSSKAADSSTLPHPLKPLFHTPIACRRRRSGLHPHIPCPLARHAGHRP